jgi:hypothetical protein
MIVSTLVLYFLRNITAVYRNITNSTVLLEVTPPAFSEKTAYATQQLIATLYEIADRRTVMEGTNTLIFA